ncbi:MAG: hypothetical protein ACI9T7_000148 [Oleiphilaceae bacterium]|jgi:hypothetical protein
MIKCFGYDTECLNISDFEAVLSDKYKNMQVSIISKNVSGMDMLKLVKVQSDGSLIGSHCGKSISLTGFFY